MAWLIVARWLHVLSVSLLFGAALFPRYGVDKSAAASVAELCNLPRLLLWSAVVAMASGAVWFLLIIAAIGVPTPRNIIAIDGFVWLWFGRLALTATMIAVLIRGRNEIIVIISSALLLLSLTWLGHDATRTNATAAVHMIIDVIHLIASSVWVGALFMFTLMLARTLRPRSRSETQLVHDALARFSHIGPGIVIALVLSGIANSGLVGPQNALQSFDSLYSQVLVGKIGLFVLMLALAAANRYWLTPRLHAALGAGGSTQAAIHALSVSLIAETMLAIFVLAAVGWLGALPPPGA